MFSATIRMQLTKPPWINHNGGVIYAIDIHPSGSKVVTCGQGNQGGSGLVVVWNIQPVLDEQLSIDTNCPKILSRMLHSQCVNCVRWSRDGKYLACSGDDHLVTIWICSDRRINSIGTIGSDSAVNIEQYRCIHRLHGHSMDVLHIEWSYDGRWLASCSVDNTIIVWNANKFPDQIVTLNSTERNGHTDIVKGIGWDPIGRYLSTQSSDKTLKIWNTDTWKCAETITRPFVDSCQSTMFARHDWSPNGSELIVPCASNNGGPTAQILLRNKDWNNSRDLVGHRRAVTCVRTCSRLFEHKTTQGKSLQAACFAVGSRDKGISIWLIPGVDRPIVVVQDLFKHSVMDLSWNGLHLMACSMDGSVASIKFGENELGRMMSVMEMGDICEKLYSKRPAHYMSITNGYHSVDAKKPKLSSVPEIVDDADILRRQIEIDKQKAMSNHVTTTSQLSSTTPVATISTSIPTTTICTKQTETRTKDGKRRIAPVCLASTLNGSIDDMATPLAPLVCNDTIGNSTSTILSPTSRTKQSLQTISVSAASVISPKRKSTVHDETPNLKRKTNDISAETIVPTKKSVVTTSVSSIPDSRPDANRNRHHIQPTTSIASTSSSHWLLQVPIRQTTLSIKVENNIHNSQLPDTVQVQNDFNAGGQRLVRLSALRLNNVVWSTVVDSPIGVIAANREIIGCGCFDRTVCVFSSRCGRSLRRFVVDSPPVIIQCTQLYLMIVTAAGYCSVFDLKTNTAIVNRHLLQDIVDNDVTISSQSISSSGAPIFSLSNGKSFIYSLHMKCWELMVDSSSALLQLADSIPSAVNQAHIIGDQSLPLQSLLSILPNKMPTLTPAINASNTIRSDCTQLMLEHRLQSAAALESPHEYRFYLHQYVQRLVADESEAKLTELIESLLSTNNRDGVVAGGLRTIALVDELLPLIDANARLRPLLAQFKRRIELAKGDDNDIL